MRGQIRPENGGITRVFHKQSLVRNRPQKGPLNWRKVFPKVNQSLEFFEGVEHNNVKPPSELLQIGVEQWCHTLVGRFLGKAPEFGKSLLSPITEEEIKSALFLMGNDKSLCPDGFTVYFFKHAWKIVHKYFITAIQHYFSTSELHREVNFMIIALVPKKEKADRMKDFQPIPCCNVVYKCITKVIANRLKVVLPDIISLHQTAFVQGRKISDNVLLTHELIKQGITPRCAIKIDLMKDFDSLNWDFVLNNLEAMGFPSTFLRWIKRCITSPHFSVAINGSLAGYIVGQRGLRQGDPLSPYLFVIAMEVFSNLMNTTADEGRVDFHPRCGGKVNWETVCLPKTEGGLGVKDLALWNKLLGECSWNLRKLMQLRTLMAPYIHYRVGPDTSMSFWYDPWLPIGPLIHYCTRGLQCFPSLKEHATVSKVLAEGYWHWPRSSDPQAALIRDLAATIQPFGHDRVSWTPHKSKQFSIAKAWKCLRTRKLKMEWRNAVWFEGQFPRSSFVSWLCVQNRLATKDRLLKWGISLCGSGM
ncbi:hypothetical protein CRG98_003343 [Punica granatum]|uniref:Reverse transcriptase domain-containing protein n=1 Tax=Punica granatum TaxID=22663 RepID=A0A2I0L6A4_PUNGR|nr:hypothetical protein CRG98_003343 [Punica granatum]